MNTLSQDIKVSSVTNDEGSGGYVIGLESGYGVGGRVLDERKIVVYTEGLLSANNDLSCGDVVTLYDSDGNPTSTGLKRSSSWSSWNGKGGINPLLGEEASRFIETKRGELRDPLILLTEETKKLYEQAMEPLKIVPVKATTTLSDIKQIGYSLTYPISLPLALLYHILKGNLKGHGGSYVLSGLITTPLHVLHNAKEGNLFQEYVAGVSIENPDTLSDAPIDENSLMLDIFPGDDGEKNPHFFGDSTSTQKKYAYLSGFFPGGLEVSESHIGQIPNKNCDPFTERGRWYKQVSGTLHTQINDISTKGEEEWQRYRDITNQVKTNMAIILKESGIL